MKWTATIALLALIACGDDAAPAEIYEGCRSDGDCTSTRCEAVTVEGEPPVTERLCTTICGGSSDCPSTRDGGPGVCASVGDSPFVCWASCSGDRDCEPGFECGFVDGESICVPEAEAPMSEVRADYEACLRDSDCDSGQCESVTAEWGDRTTTDSICTRACDDESDCQRSASGIDGICAAFGGGDFLCYEQCAEDADCAGGFRCGELDGTGFFICLPY